MHRLRLLFLATSFAATVTLLPAAVSAAPVNQTGPTGAQCNLKGMDGDFVDPGNSDTTNNSNISLSGLSGTPAMHVAGCDITMAPPPPPPPTPTPVPPRNTALGQLSGTLSR